MLETLKSLATTGMIVLFYVLLTMLVAALLGTDLFISFMLVVLCSLFIWMIKDQ